MFAGLALTFPAIDPVLISIGPLAIRWYALAYIAGIVLGWLYLSYIDRRFPPPLLAGKARDDIMTWAIFGIIFGGRVGYVLFYNLPYYMENPSEIIAIWKGGMSFHGGLVGATLAFYCFARRYNISFLALMDLVACAAPIGLFFGRIANFINGELYGRVTDSPFGMVFPHGGPLPRHPSQLYEAGLEGIVLFIVLAIIVFLTPLRAKRGFITGLFLTDYALFRFLAEFARQPDEQLGFILGPLTMGQILCLPMFLFGSVLMAYALTHAAIPAKK